MMGVCWRGLCARLLYSHIRLPFPADFTGKAKWDAWKKNEGLSQEEAKQKYVETLLAIFEKNGEWEMDHSAS